MTAGLSLGLVVAAATLYVLAPGHAQVLLNGIPIGQAGIAVLVILLGGWAWTRRQAAPAPAKTVLWLAVAIAAKVTIGVVAPATGWLAHYYANETLTPPMERSIDFRGLTAATRIDPALSLFETEFPVHFYNDRKYNTGVYREWSMPFSVQWTGHVAIAEPGSRVVRVSANGAAELLVDGVSLVTVAAVPGSTGVAETTLTLTPGQHVIDVRYRKPADSAALFRLERQGEGQWLPAFSWAEVTPFAAGDSSRAVIRPALAAAWLLHGVALAITLAGVWPTLRRQRQRLAGAFAQSPLQAIHELAAPVVVLGLLAQGLWRSRHLVGRVWTLSGGDDWLNYEMAARDAVLDGLMMSEGGVIGHGQPFSLYPGYAYFVAFVHALTGESLAGVVLVNFVLLAAATMVAYGIARRLLGPVPALGGLAWLLVLEQADFVRYYTVTLFSENLYFLLAALTVLFLIIHIKDGGWRSLVGAAVMGGLAAMTRPSMMLLLPVAVGLVLVAHWRAHGVWRSLAKPTVLAAVWLATLSPITLRNYLMSGNPVLITAGQAATFIAYNMPVNDPKYFKSFDGTLSNGAWILLWMLVEHPVASLANYGTKLGFSLGMVHWMGSGTRHPELVLTTLLYLAGLVLLPRLRTLAALPMHAFIATHVATLMLTMPSNYGYRMILPAFVFMSLVAGAVVMGPVHRMAASRWPALGHNPAEASS